MKKRKSLAAKFVIGFVIMGILICTAVTGIGYFHYKNYIQEQYNEKAYQVAKVFHEYMTESEIEEYIHMAEAYAAGEVTNVDTTVLRHTASYRRHERLIYSLREQMDVNDVFMAYIDQDIVNSYDGNRDNWQPLTYILDSYVKPDLKFKFGERGNFNPMYIGELQEMFVTGQPVDNYFISSSDFGYNISALYPLTVDGKVKGLICVEVPMKALQSVLHEYIVYSVGATVCCIGLVLAVYMVYLYRRMVSPINLIAHEAGSFLENNTEISERLGTVSTGDEIQTLSETVLQMEIGIKEYIANLTRVTAEKERIGAELNVAKQIQADMLPSIFPAFPERKEFDIFASMEPAKEVGGDFYDFFLVDDDHLAFLIADVSGKGVPAALFMVITKTLLNNHAMVGESLSEIFERVNNQLCENNKEGMFVTAWMGLLEISTGKLTYVNAGHNPPLVKGADAVFRYLQCRPGFVLAGMEDMMYQEGEVQLEKGSSIYLYTDGVTESINEKEELYGEDRLDIVLNRHKEDGPDKILEAVKESMDEFVGEAEQFDDITMLCLTYRG